MDRCMWCSVGGRVMFNTEDGDNKFLRNLGKHIDHKALEPKISLSNCKQSP